MCFNKRVLIGLGVVALGVLAVSPRSFGAVAPLLMMAVCPLSMLFMMGTMGRDGTASCDTKASEADPSTLGETGLEPATAAGPDDRVRSLEREVERLKAELRPREQDRVS